MNAQTQTHSRYVPINREQFTEKMQAAEFVLVNLPGCLELVFERQVVRKPRTGCGCMTAPGGELPQLFPYRVRIYSTIDVRTDDSRECGADAIRVVLTDLNGKQLMGERKVLRTKSALENTLERARDLWRYVLDSKHYCPACKAIMIEREGKYGKFFGCSRYPECKQTK